MRSGNPGGGRCLISLYRLLLDWGAETETGLNSTLSVTTRSMSRRLRETQAADTTLSLEKNKIKYKLRELSVKLERLPIPDYDSNSMKGS